MRLKLKQANSHLFIFYEFRGKTGIVKTCKEDPILLIVNAACHLCAIFEALILDENWKILST
jgi:hypothetical protein